MGVKGSDSPTEQLPHNMGANSPTEQLPPNTDANNSSEGLPRHTDSGGSSGPPAPGSGRPGKTGAIATAKSPATKIAQALAWQTADTHQIAITRTNRQVERALQGWAAEPTTQEAPQAQATRAAASPMPRLGLLRCNLRKCRSCAVGRCRTSREKTRASNSCPCHNGQRGTYWDIYCPCMTPYTEASPSQAAIGASPKAAAAAATPRQAPPATGTRSTQPGYRAPCGPSGKEPETLNGHNTI